VSAERERVYTKPANTRNIRETERETLGAFFRSSSLYLCFFRVQISFLFEERERENTFCFPGVLQLSAKRERERNLLFFFLTFSWMPPKHFSSSSKEILEQDSVELLEIELRRLTNAVEKLEESNRYLEKAIEEEEEEEADLDIYRRAIKENAKAIPEHQSKIFEISQRIRELKPSQRGEDRKDDDRSAWL